MLIESDSTLALEGEEVTSLVALDLAARLNEREPIPYFVDVVATASLTNPDLVEHIRRVGKVIYQRQHDRPGE